MADTNNYEATLSSKYVDGVSRALEQTAAGMQGQLAAFAASGSAAMSSIDQALEHGMQSLKNWGDHLRQLGSESDSVWKRMGLAATGGAIAIAAALAMAAKSIASWVFSIAKEASELTEVKLAYEGLTQAVGWHSDSLSKLKQATEGIVPTMELVRNANRVMQSGLKLSDEQYVKLTENIFRLGKAAAVDGAQSVNALTDSLIRGNSRALAAVGIHINVKDAVTEMAAANGEAASKVTNSAQRIAFQNEMLQKTSAAVKLLPPEFISLQDALTRADRTWRSFAVSIGEAINRSGVFQELIKRLTGSMSDLELKKDGLDKLTLSVNRFIISTLEGISSLATAWSFISPIISAIVGTTVGAFNLLQGGIALAMTGVSAVIEGVAMVIDSFTMGKIPGLKSAIAWLHATTSSSAKVANESLSSLGTAYSGLAQGAKNAAEFADRTHAMAQELRQFSSEIVHGTAGVNSMGKATATAAVDQQKLNEQLRTYGELLRELNKQSATPAEVAMIELQGNLDKINQLNLISAQQRQELIQAAFNAYYAKQMENYLKEQEDAQRNENALAEIERQSQIKRLNQLWSYLKLVYQAPIVAAEQAERDKRREASAAASAAEGLMSAISMSRSGKLSGSVGASAVAQLDDVQRIIEQRLQELQTRGIVSAADINEVVRLRTELDKIRTMKMTPWMQSLQSAHAELQRLNKVSMNPFSQALQSMKENVLEFAQQSAQAFSDFFANIVSGQEGAGRKLLAAFLGMIGQMLTKTGSTLIMLGIAEVAAAHTALGRLFWGASAAAGWKAIATGAVLIAAGGAASGLASSMSSNSSTSSSTSSSSSSASTSSSSSKVIQVGQAGYAQNAGEASMQRRKDELTVRLELDSGGVLKVVEKNIRSNGRLRAVVASA